MAPQIEGGSKPPPKAGVTDGDAGRGKGKGKRKGKASSSSEPRWLSGGPSDDHPVDGDGEPPVMKLYSLQMVQPKTTQESVRLRLQVQTQQVPHAVIEAQKKADEAEAAER